MDTEELWQRIADTVEGRRLAECIPSTGLAARAGVDDSTVRRLLAGEPVRLSSLRLVLDAVGIDWGEFLLDVAA